ncbi:glutathione S-transferase 1 [Ixodes scapularis]|uniref:glutathione S-transferase 1 n=1 Tax=Ixodes scapularis TaxID=6945 RepID=UPI001A9F601E|nr:glutathione S-transferase 1 [Ixodes scapularis]
MSVILYSCEPSAPCRVVRMVAKHIGLPLTIKEVDIPAGDTKKEDFLKLNPAHTVPTMVDGSLVLFESRAIVTYLVDKYAAGSPLYPQDIEKRAVINNLLMFDIGTLYKTMSAYFYPALLFKKEYDPATEAPMNDALQVLGKLLSDKPYLTGSDISLADIVVAGTLSFVDVADYSLDAHPKVRDYYSALKKDLPYYAEVNDKGIEMFRKYSQK